MKPILHALARCLSCGLELGSAGLDHVEAYAAEDAEALSRWRWLEHLAQAHTCADDSVKATERKDP